MGTRKATRLLLVPMFAALLAIGPGTSAQTPGTLSIGFAGGLGIIDPAIAYDYITIPVLHSMFDTLVTYDDGATIVPGVAAAMPTISADGLTYTFDLRPDVPFVRKGEVVRMMTADDVVYSINRVLRPDLKPTPSPVGPSFFSIIEGADAVIAGTATEASGIRKVDADTVEFTLTHPDRTFLNALAMTFGSIVPADLAGMDATAFAADPVGTGPFYLDSYTPDQQVILHRNPHYWRAGSPKVDAVEVRLGISAQEQALAVGSGQLDIMGQVITPGDWATVNADPDLADNIVSTELGATEYLALDTSGPDSPFTDPLVRQAVNLVIDKANIIRLLNGRVVVNDCIIPPSVPGFDADCHPYPTSVEDAQALMAKAGNHGFDTELVTDDSEQSRLMAESIAADLLKLDIVATVRTMDFDAFISLATTPHGAPMALTGWFQDFPDPADFIDPILSCASAVAGGTNMSWYCDPAVDVASADARKITDIGEAIPRYQEIQRTIMDAAPLVPLFTQVQDGLVSDRVTGLAEFHPVWTWDLPAYGLR